METTMTRRAGDDDSDLRAALREANERADQWKMQAYREAAANADKMELLESANKTLRATNKTLRIEVEYLERMLEESATADRADLHAGHLHGHRADLSENEDTADTSTAISTEDTDHADTAAGEYTADDVWKRFVIENGLREEMRNWILAKVD